MDRLDTQVFTLQVIYLIGDYKVDIIKKKYYNEQNTYITGDYKGSIIK